MSLTIECGVIWGNPPDRVYVRSQIMRQATMHSKSGMGLSLETLWLDLESMLFGFLSMDKLFSLSRYPFSSL